MPASVIEQQAVTCPASGASVGTVTLATTLVASDVIVITRNGGSTSSFLLGGTIGSTGRAIIADQQGLSGHRVTMWWQTGVTGAGLTITGSTNLSPYPSRMRVHVIRGLNSPVVDYVNWSGFGNHQPQSSFPSYPGPATIGPNQVAIAHGSTAAASCTFPTDSYPIGSTWAQYDMDTTGMGPSAMATYVGTNRLSGMPGLRSVTGNYGGVIMAVFGTADTPPTPHVIVRGSQVYRGGPTITTPTLVTSDVLVLVTSTLNSISLTPGGVLVWTLYHHYRVATGNTRVRVYTATGLTGAQTFTLTTSLNDFNCFYTMYVVRGLTSPGTFAASASTWQEVDGVVDPADVVLAANTPEGPAPLSGGPGQVAIFYGAINDNHFHDMPPYTPTPSTGWSVDQHTTQTEIGPQITTHRVIDSTTPVQAFLRSQGAVRIGSTMLLLGAAPAPPPVDMGGTWGG